MGGYMITKKAQIRWLEVEKVKKKLFLLAVVAVLLMGGLFFIARPKYSKYSVRPLVCG